MREPALADDLRGPGPATALPVRFEVVEELDEFLSRPTQALVEDMGRLDGDILLLGVAGKMGPTLARLARRARPRGSCSAAPTCTWRSTAPATRA